MQQVLKQFVMEARLVRRQARDLRRLRDFSTAYVFKRVSQTWMKAARKLKLYWE